MPHTHTLSFTFANSCCICFMGEFSTLNLILEWECIYVPRVLSSLNPYPNPNHRTGEHSRLTMMSIQVKHIFEASRVSSRAPLPRKQNIISIRHQWLLWSLQYLERYIYLILFNTYLHLEKKNSWQRSFTVWMEQVQDLCPMYTVFFSILSRFDIYIHMQFVCVCVCVLL